MKSACVGVLSIKEEILFKSVPKRRHIKFKPPSYHPKERTQLVHFSPCTIGIQHADGLTEVETCSCDWGLIKERCVCDSCLLASLHKETQPDNPQYLKGHKDTCAEANYLPTQCLFCQHRHTIQHTDMIRVAVGIP